MTGCDASFGEREMQSIGGRTRAPADLVLAFGEPLADAVPVAADLKAGHGGGR